MPAPRPNPEWERAMMRDLVRQFPHGGNPLERAIREALRLGFAAGRDAGSGVGTADPFPASERHSETHHA